MKKIYATAILFLIIFSSTSQTIYTGKPIYKIDVKRAGIFIGSIKVELFPNIAYHHVRNFDSLVSVHFYDTTAFHRVIPGFVIQGGDPNSRHGDTTSWGFGQPGQPNVNAEFSVAKHVRGIISAARSSNINSATSQFFICVAAAANLNGQYSIYGRVASGLNLVDTIVLAPRNTNNNRPYLKHEMFITALGSNDTVPLAPTLSLPINGKSGLDASTAINLKWNKVNDAIIYTVEISDDPFYINVVKTFDTPELTSTIFSGLDMYTKYYWHVRANNGGHFSNWSSDWNFNTFPNYVGLENNTSNTNNKVNVFPNPSDGKFIFEYLQKNDKVVIYDIIGNLIFQGIAIETNLIIDIETKDKGVYFYRIYSDKNISEGKLILK
jgi:peptidyl-prolyl cis-trans isomerase B (cyclophilin B)